MDVAREDMAEVEVTEEDSDDRTKWRCTLYSKKVQETSR